ncbi:NAD(P)H-binding protein [Brachybacterium hainanense]|uniref:NAD(P)H-binding protein n=1 Tax=Brachybacterium hainanense TaxID=1541174 RepID=A0ABV6R711_9MICO
MNGTTASAPRGVIAVTGASGRIGGRVGELLAAHVPASRLRLIARDAARAPRIPGAAVAEASYADPAACAAALEGVATLLLVSAAESADRLAEHACVIDAAARAGVRHIVYTSFLGAAADAEFTLARDHGATEDMLRAAGPRWTFLRDSFYADVLLDFAGPDRVIRGPAGTGRCAFVARADVAAVAARVLQDPAPWTGRALDLTGPDALDLAEAAAIMSRVRGQDFAFVDETLAQARASRAPYGAPEWQVEAWISTYTAIASGALDVVSGHVQEVLGRPPIPLAEVMAAPL